MAPHSSTLAWKIPWMEEPGGLQSMGSLRVRHDWVTSRSLFTFMHWRRKWQPTPVFLPGESQDGGAWWAAVYGVSQSRTRLKQLSSSSSSSSMVILKQSSVPQSVMPFISIIEEFMCESIEERHLVYFTGYISTVFESGLSLIHSQYCKNLIHWDCF